MIRAPIRSTIELTYKCNQRCSYCYNPHHSGGFISFDGFVHVADELINESVFSIALAGGEPLLHPRFFEFYDYIADRAFAPPIILTNGSVADETDVRKLVDRSKNRPLRLQVSLDSLKPVIGMQNRLIKKTVAFLDSLIRYGIRPSIGTVLTSLNIDNVPQLIQRFESNILAYHLMAPQEFAHTKEYIRSTRPTKAQVEGLKKYIDIVRNSFDISIEGGFDESELKTVNKSGCHSCKGCAAGFTKAVVDPSLNVLACEITPSLVLGNLRESSLSEIWKNNRTKYIQSQDFPLCHNIARLRLVETKLSKMEATK